MLEARHPDNGAKVHAAFQMEPRLVALQSSLYTSQAPQLLAPFIKSFIARSRIVAVKGLTIQIFDLEKLGQYHGVQHLQ